MVGIFLNPSSPYFLRQGLSWNPEFVTLARMVASKLRNPPAPVSSTLGYVLSCLVCQGPELVPVWHFTHLAVAPGPQTFLFIVILRQGISVLLRLEVTI